MHVTPPAPCHSQLYFYLYNGTNAPQNMDKDTLLVLYVQVYLADATTTSKECYVVFFLYRTQSFQAAVSVSLTVKHGFANIQYIYKPKCI